MKKQATATPRLHVCDTCRQTIEGTLALSKRLCFCGAECAHEWSAKVLEAATSLDEGNLIVAAIAYIEAVYTGRGGTLAFTVLEAAARRVSERLRRLSAEMYQSAEAEQKRQQVVEQATDASVAKKPVKAVPRKRNPKPEALAFSPSIENLQGVQDDESS